MYGVDIHQCYGPPGTPWVSVGGVRPFQIPLGSLIPSDATNLITACKNIGGTHLTSGAYRVHPGEWAIGEAAGILAAYCVGQNVRPAEAHGNASRVAALQLRLLEQGVPIFWWDDLDYTSDPQDVCRGPPARGARLSHRFGEPAFSPNGHHLAKRKRCRQQSRRPATPMAGRHDDPSQSGFVDLRRARASVQRSPSSTGVRKGDPQLRLLRP